MTDSDKPADKLLLSLQERAKELNCLYEVEQVLNQHDLSLEVAFQRVVEAIPPGWQYPDVCRATIVHDGKTFLSSEFEPTEWVLRTDILVQDSSVGTVSVYYVEERPREAIGPFLHEEQRLIKTIADRLAHFILFQQLKQVRQEWEKARRSLSPERSETWISSIELLRRTDRELYLRIARKLVNYMCWVGVDEARPILEAVQGASGSDEEPVIGEINVPGRSPVVDHSALMGDEVFELASSSLGDDELLLLIQQWILRDKASFLPRTLHNMRASLAEITDSIRRYQHMVTDATELSESAQRSFRVSLIRRFLTEHLEFISIAREYLEPADFGDLLDRVVHTADSHGKLGGKSAGLFLAQRILAINSPDGQAPGELKVPKSWYLASDGLMSFVMTNELEEVLEQKYKDIGQVRRDYPNIVHLIKSSRFPPEIVKGLSVALDDLGDVPLIVRSSSILEDRLGSAFSGKYKSLFLANRGSKKRRLEALLNAISEVYASVFGPDPIEYRRERGLLDFHEEMAILIQEVVGRRVGRYYLPAFAGVAFSTNEFCWAPTIRREDGLIRIVPGLGTRAVDRVSDDYPILAVPGQTEHKVNSTMDEQLRYSPRMADVINLENGRFETVAVKDLLRELGTDFPAFEQVFSQVQEDRLTRPVRLLVDPRRDELVANFDGLIGSTDFPHVIAETLGILQEALGTPVDIEFAHDGEDLYLLQCRAQSYAPEAAPAPIPKELPEEDVLFSANRYVSNGWVPDVTHLVFVDPDGYSELADRSQMREVGRVVSELNKLLPKRQFVLMGPGRWGSRGDIMLGVPVTYSDINNTAALIEIARRHGNYRPDLSFGTHFFQDLVEASIRYLPLYPDEDSILNERFLRRAPNLLASMLPEAAWLEATVKVIDLPASTGGRVLRVLMNAELGEAVGMLAAPSDERLVGAPEAGTPSPKQPDIHWRWRLQMAELIAAEVEPERFGVVAMYVIGSAKNATAGPSSDIDLLVHFRGDERQRADLESWLEGWSLCLAEMNYQRTGYRERALLDVHIVTDDDIDRRTSFAVKIDAVTDAARKLPLGPRPGG